MLVPEIIANPVLTKGQGGASIGRFDPFVPEFRLNPYPFYHRYRTHDPVHWGKGRTPDLPGTWYLFRYDDVMAALKEPRLGRERRRVLPNETFRPVPEEYRAFGEMSGKWMLFRDPPDHTRLRALVARAFSPHVIEGLGPIIDAIVNDLLDVAQANSNGAADQKLAKTGHMDFVTDFAYPFPVMVIAKMLGIPTDDYTLFRDFSNAFAHAIDLRTSMSVYKRASEATIELTAYLRQIVYERRRRPQDDLISGLIAAEEQSDKLSEDELLSMCILLLISGHETTVNLMASGLLSLLHFPDQLDKLRANPDLIGTAIEELLRFEPPIQITFRVAFEELIIGDKTIRKGDDVAIMLGAAARDPAQFPNPDQLDIARKEVRHSAFGLGIHYCIGAELARLEGRIAFNTLLKRMPALQLETETPTWRDTVAFRGLTTLPVSFNT